MPTRFYLLLAMCAFIGGTSNAYASQETDVDGHGLPAPIKRADETLAAPSADGNGRPLTVTIKQWSLIAGKSFDRFPEQGHLIVQLRAGRVVTIIDGEREERKEGEFWEVAPGSSMGLEVTSEMAILQVTAIKPADGTTR